MQEKNIITRESCHKELLWLTKADLRSELIIFAIALVILIPLIAAGVYLMKYILLIGIVTILVCLAPIVFLSVMTIRDAIRMKLAKDGKFSIVRAAVSRTAKGESVRGSRSTYNALYFGGYGRFIPSNTVFGLSSEGDEFYLVILHTKNNELCFAYHTILYDLKEA